MKWYRHPDMDALTATGLRGSYYITHLARTWFLSGAGHDGLLMLDFPVGGRKFATVESAREYAERVDAVKAREGEMSGC